MRIGGFIAALVIMVGLGLTANAWWPRAQQSVNAAGTLEARSVHLGSKVGGRITQVLVNEGDQVAAGQLLVVFDGAEVEAKVLQAQGKLAQARAYLEKLQSGSRPEDIAEARAAVVGPHGEDGYLVEEIARLRSDLERVQSEADNTERTFQRMEQLCRENLITEQVRDDSQARSKMAWAEVESRQRAIAAAEGRLRAAKAALDRAEHGFRPEEIAMARADVMRVEGELKEAEARFAEREVHAASAGVVEVMDLRPGDLVAPNTSVVQLLEADQLYVRVYVPQSQVGRVTVGQHARLFVDAFAQGFAATVEQIRQQAEFLPRNVQTADAREHQVFGVKLRVNNPERRLRAGVSARVEFLDEVK